jgi:hypothetical protein
MLSRSPFGALAALTLACATASRPSTGGTSSRPIARLDHIMFLTPHPSALISLLADTLQLPLVWPAPRDAASTSSGLGFGNVNLEIMHRATDESFVSSLALQARDWSSFPEECRKLGIETGDPAPGPIDTTKFPREPRWTVRALRGLGRGVFVIQYHQFDMDERRARVAQQLVERGGGPLGVVRMRETIVAAESSTVRAAAWIRLFGLPHGRSSWRVGDGPGITVVDADDPQRDLLVVEVRSLRRARHVLDSLRIGYVATQREVRLDGLRLHGLRLALLEADERESSRRSP